MSVMVILNVKLAVLVWSSAAAGVLIAVTSSEYIEPRVSRSRAPESETTTILSEMEKGALMETTS